ncbi:isochorismate synthase [Falsibacillus albus]|uniref:isochorismate synthase n=2 Tax=Falsibacillus albus TaxID=2478915 RepID=A0A3L7K639_9BACI|nr:isochorismate synthase [Falsibacillus albus]
MEILFSTTMEIQDADGPLAFFEYGNEKFNGERFLWKDSQNHAVLVGVGIEKSFSHERTDHNRFFEAETEWKRFIDRAVIENPFEVPGTGPLLFGGFSFDPMSEKETEWAAFADSLFYLPKFMLTISQGKSYLTVNVACDPNDDLGAVTEIENFQMGYMQFQQKRSIQSPIISDMEEINKEEWIAAVADVVRQLKQGDVDKVVLARKMKVHFDEPILTEMVLQNLWQQQPDSFIFALEALESCFIGASPERLIQKTNNTVFSTCLAGSIARGKETREDELLGKELLNDRKNLHEHQLVVKMIVEVLKKHCIDIQIPENPALLKLRDIQHLYTPVTGTVDGNLSITKLVEALHPTPALGGVPRQRAMHIIREKEQMDRGMYASPIGWMDYRDNGEFAVAIRSGLIKQDEAVLYAGCGVVADSDPQSEYIETKIKFRPMYRAIGGTEE